MPASDELIDALARAYGIGTEYWDIWGNRHPTSSAVARTLLGVMHVAIENDAAALAALHAREELPWRRTLPPAVVIRADAPLVVPVVLPACDAVGMLAWSLHPEDGAGIHGSVEIGHLHREGERIVDGALHIRFRFIVPHDPGDGYHTLDVSAGATRARTRFIRAPATCHVPAALDGGGRVWGLAAQLYAVRSERNWGIGDFGDLRALVDLAAAAGAGIVGLNPLHALFPGHPERASPYGPSTRLQLDILYIDVEAVPGYATCGALGEALASDDWSARLAAARAADLVDYPAVARLKLDALNLLWDDFRARGADDPDMRDFRAWQRERGEPLRWHALHDALHEAVRCSSPAAASWHDWPAQYGSPETPAVAAFAGTHAERIDFHAWLQWLADVQLEASAGLARARGLAIGLYQDLSVSIDGGGAEAWAWQQLYGRGASVGAPPDDFNLHGQDWGLPPMLPGELVEAAYLPYIETLRACMRHAGALRIDHVMGLLRLFWVPTGCDAVQGAYVHYPLDDLLGILALESRRNRCLVIGEDLGTVPDEVRSALAPLGVLSYRIGWFEKDWQEGTFLPPDRIERQALVSATTHDLPTVAGWWLGVDFAERDALGLFPTPELRERLLAERERDRHALLRALAHAGLLPEGADDPAACSRPLTPDLLLAIHARLARAPSAVMLVQLEDVVGQVGQVNVPGTVDERPNWRHRLPLTLSALARDPHFVALAGAMRAERSLPVGP